MERVRQQFAQDHERSLAYRYEPANDQERALVLQYFPPVVFSLKRDDAVEVSIDGIRTSADETTVFWDAVKALEFKESSFGNALVVTHPEKNALGPGAKTSKSKLPCLKKDKDQFNAVVAASIGNGTRSCGRTSRKPDRPRRSCSRRLERGCLNSEVQHRELRPR